MSRPTLARTLPDPAVEPTITVPRGSAIAGVGRNTGYDRVARGEWPSIRIGSRVVLPTARWLAVVGLSDD